MEHIMYDSGIKTVPMEQDEIDTGSQNGLSWVLIGRYVLEGRGEEQTPIVALTWIFDSKELRAQGADAIGGRIRATLLNGATQTIVPIDFELTKDVQQVRAHFDVTGNPKALKMRFEFEVVPYNRPPPEIHVDPVFEKSDLTDAVLRVEGQLLHVNKTFLSVHSDYFKALFSGNFAETNMEVIPIEEVRCEDFQDLLKVVYPRPQFPKDSNAYTLLELAQRFLLPGVMDHVEKHLLTNSELPNDKILYMADKFHLGKLIEYCILQINSFHELNRIKNSSEYMELSAETKAKILDKIIHHVGYNGDFTRNAMPIQRPLVRKPRPEAPYPTSSSSISSRRRKLFSEND